MSANLKPYQPTDKGRELITILFPLSHSDREKSIQEYWHQYPKEIDALIDGFHFLVQEIADGRSNGDIDDQIRLSNPLLTAIFKGMQSRRNFFAYQDTADFLAALNELKPPVFSDPKSVSELLMKVESTQSTGTGSAVTVRFDESVRQQLNAICQEVAAAYEETAKALPSIRNAQITIEQAKASQDSFALMDKKLAEVTLSESKSRYEKQARLIASHWPYVYELYSQNNDQIEVAKVYVKYLAKLLASREARYPAEKYVLRLAEGDFDFEIPDFSPTQQQLQRGITRVNLAGEYLKELKRHASRLESRYRKRKLMVKLKSNAPKSKIIEELLQIVQTDPEDIKTMILLARLFSEYAKTIKSHEKSVRLREQALKYCNLAFSRIDDYLDLQQIEKMKERDQYRAGFVKTISAIRIPLIKKKKQ